MNVPVHGCTCAGMHLCMKVPIHKWTCAWAYLCMYVPVHELSCAWTYQCMNVGTYAWQYILVHELLVHKQTCAWTCLCMNVPVHERANAWMYLYMVLHVLLRAALDDGRPQSTLTRKMTGLPCLNQGDGSSVADPYPKLLPSRIGIWIQSKLMSRIRIRIRNYHWGWGLLNKCSDINTIFNIKSLISAQKRPLNVHSNFKCENFTKFHENFSKRYGSEKIRGQDPDPDPKWPSR